MEGYVSELYCACFFRLRLAALMQVYFGFQHFIDTACRYLSRRQEHNHHNHHHYGHDNISRISAEYHYIAKGRNSGCHIGNINIIDNGCAHPVYDQSQSVHGQGYRRHKQRQGTLVKKLRPHQSIIGLFKFLRLILFSVKSMNYIDAGKIFS